MSRKLSYKIANRFSNGTEYECFRYKYCDNGCIYHKEREDGFTEFVENGGCPIENALEDARLIPFLFPMVLVEVWENKGQINERCLNWHHCPFFNDRSEEE